MVRFRLGRMTLDDVKLIRELYFPELAKYKIKFRVRIYKKPDMAFAIRSSKYNWEIRYGIPFNYDTVFHELTEVLTNISRTNGHHSEFFKFAMRSKVKRFLNDEFPEFAKSVRKYHNGG